MLALSGESRPCIARIPALERPLQHMATLHALRFVALRCRADRRTDLFQACAMIGTQQQIEDDVHAKALMRCLHEVLNQRPVFYQPGTATVSFDEAWLMQAILAAQRDDRDSLLFLIRSRVQRKYQRHVNFLIKGISDSFDLL